MLRGAGNNSEHPEEEGRKRAEQPAEGWVILAQAPAAAAAPSNPLHCHK